MKKLVFSHGFGVGSDARGLFTDISAHFADYESMMFDYNTEEDGVIFVPELPVVRAKLEEVLAKSDHGTVLIAHSLGCVIAAISELPKLNQIVLLAPPTNQGIEYFIEHISSRPGVAPGDDGTIRLLRSDGRVTQVSNSFIDGILSLDVDSEYRKLAADQNLEVVNAEQDSVLGSFPLKIDDENTHTVLSNHDFSREGRSELLRSLETLLTDK